MDSIEKHIRTIKDFPKEGISFKDITPLLLHHQASKECLDAFIAAVKEHKIDKVVGIESRGFFFGTLIAHELKAGFIPVRKPKKLPYETISATYELEYGTDTLEMHIDAIQKGDKVLIHDDVLATGGTAKAVGELVEKLGGEIVQFSFIMELGFLEGRKKIAQYPVFSVLKY
jgi:adenine phosphoribosyltransferase